MPARVRIKTKYPGVYYIVVGKEKAYYIVYRRKGETKQIEEKVEIPGKTMTPALANQLRAERVKGKVLSNRERRRAKEEAAQAEKEKMTISRLWKSYRKSYSKRAAKIHEDMASFKSDKSRYNIFILPSFGDKEPSEIIPLDIERLERKILKGKKAQTIKHVLGLLERIVGYGARNGLCTGLTFPLEKPSVENVVTETLNKDELKALIKALDEGDDIQVSHLMKLALYTGMRRGELFKLRWDDVDFEKGFIFIRSPKGKKSVHIPMNDQARDILKSHPRIAEHVFVTDKGKPFTEIRKRIDAIRTAAGLPKGFRPLHGLRHVYASLLASSGQVDIYTLQRLLTHKSTAMTQRYAHLMDETLRNASQVMVDVMEGVKDEKAG